MNMRCGYNVADMISQELEQITGGTLKRLRQIRAGVLEERPVAFEGQAREDAERLVDGLVGVALSAWKASEDERTVEEQGDLVKEVGERWGRYLPAATTYANAACDLLAWMRCIVKDENHWKLLMMSNGLGQDERPVGNDVVITPLSSGPVLVRLAQRLSQESPRVALAVVDTVSLVDRLAGEGREVYLPRETSWPKGEKELWGEGVTWVMDDQRVSHTTVAGLVEKLGEMPGVKLVY